MEDYTAILESGQTYHLYNRANGNERLFLTDEHYRYFLSKYKQFIQPVADTYSYCLMPNHFHFLLRIKLEDQLCKTFPKFETLEKLADAKAKGGGGEDRSVTDLQGFQNLEGLTRSKLISQQFSNFFNGYAKAINKQQNRKGSLFMHTFKRKLVNTENYFRKVVHYIHYNPVESGLSEKPEDWKYSSYKAIVSNKPSLIKRTAVIKMFDDLENFIYCHREPPDLTGINFFNGF